MNYCVVSNLSKNSSDFAKHKSKRAFWVSGKRMWNTAEKS